MRPLASWQLSAYGLRGASSPPLTIARVPRRIVRREWASASRPPAPSEATTFDEPFIPWRIEIWPVVAA